MWIRLRQRFGTLRWKLAGSYVLVTLLVVLTLETVLLLVGIAVITTNYLAIAQAITTDMADQIRNQLPSSGATMEHVEDGFLSAVATQDQRQAGQVGISFPPSSQAEATAEYTANDTPLDDVVVYAVTDTTGRVITTTVRERYPRGAVLADLEPAPAGDIIARALASVPPGDRELAGWSGECYQPIAAYPIIDGRGQVLGAMYARLPLPTFGELVTGLGAVLLFSGIAIVVGSGFIGVIFGLTAGRGFSRRLKRLTVASAAMASGDLEQRVGDRSPDEIGQLARQLNTMAAQLSENMRALRLLADQNAQLAEQATQLATVEERNRLARDLHDSVSQELFSLTMQAAAARRLVATKPEQAAAQLSEIQATAQQALQETRSLIFALRPAQLDGRGLGPALRDLQTAARERQGLEIDLRIGGERRLPLEHEQAVFRIVQEALANVVRHSGARRADVDLEYTDHDVRLTIKDYGRGFDGQAPATLARSVCSACANVPKRWVARSKFILHRNRAQP